MATIEKALNAHVPLGAVFVRSAIVTLTLATAAIHASLGGLLFTMNAIGYATFAIAMVLPGFLGPIRWLVRLALIGFTGATIGGWLAFGARFPLAYIDKGLEVALIAIVAFELWRLDGGPADIARRTRRTVTDLLARVS